MMKKISYILLICLLSIFPVGASGLKKEVTFSGLTMGTSYHITVLTAYFNNIAALKARINKRLDEINKSMSIYIKESDISRFNNSQANIPVQVSDDFIIVMKTGEMLYTQTQGAWDGTVGPLVNLWGFGNKEVKKAVPSKDSINRALSNVGFDRIEVLKERYLSKKNAAVFLDLGSIAKGFGVDQVADVIKQSGFNDFLVEIGGEVYASGLREDGKNWRVGVNTPRKGAAFNQVHKVVHLYNKAMATSGDYRNFFEMNGNTYSHVINPGTGYPVSNKVVSVSVISDSCTYADGLATAIMVMGKTKGLELVNQMEDTECLIITMDKDGELEDNYSKGFDVES